MLIDVSAALCFTDYNMVSEPRFFHKPKVIRIKLLEKQNGIDKFTAMYSTLGFKKRWWSVCHHVKPPDRWEFGQESLLIHRGNGKKLKFSSKQWKLLIQLKGLVAFIGISTETKCPCTKNLC